MYPNPQKEESILILSRHLLHLPVTLEDKQSRPPLYWAYLPAPDQQRGVTQAITYDNLQSLHHHKLV